MIGYYNYTVVLTYISLIVAVFGIMLGIDGNMKLALILLMISGVCDLFDGKIASTKKDRTMNERLFGVQIDSLCDLICFGALPAVLVGGKIIGSLFVLCGLIRLANFNVDATNKLMTNDKSKAFYRGLPITASALVIPGAYLVSSLCGISFSVLGQIALAVIGVLYLTPFKLKKFGWGGMLTLVAIGSVIFAGLLIFVK